MSNKPAPTANQQKAIDGSGSLLISAAAGSGKTATLVNRVIKKLTDPDDMYEITDFLIVTFTISAAAEMRSRISAAISSKLSEDISPALRRHLRKQTILLAKANISTVHSYCKNLISDNFDRLDLPPDFKIISEPRAELFKQQALTDTVEHFLETDKKQFTDLMKLLSTDSRLTNIKSAISSLYDCMNSLPFPEEWKQRCIEMYKDFSDLKSSPWGKYLIGKLLDRCNNAVDLLETTINDISRDEVLASTRGIDLSDGLNCAVLMLKCLQSGDLEGCRKYAKKENEISWSHGLPKKAVYDFNLNDRCGLARNMYNSFLKKTQDVLCYTEEQSKATAQQLTPFIELLFSAADYFARLFTAQKREINALDFSDLEHLSLKLLAKRENKTTYPTDFAKSLSEGFKEILVDEYQDTNDLQDELFRILSDDRKKLFCVGDVKQSIYGFRLSNPKNFIKMLDQYPDFEQGAERSKIILSENFRSRKGICDLVNFIFKRIMSKKIGDIEYNADHALNSSASFPERDMADTEIDIIDISKEDERTVIQVEADRIAEIIEDMMQKECITDGKTLKKPGYNDFCILLRATKTSAKPLADRLFEHGIPAVFSHDEAFFDIPEVSKMMALLKVISNPLDDVALLSAMMNPVFGFSADHIGIICSQKKRLSIYAALCNAAESGDTKASDFLAKTAFLRKFSATHTARQLISEIYEKTGLPEVYLTDEDGERKAKNLKRLLEVATECADGGYETVYEFLRFAERVKKGEIKLAGTSDTSAGGVKIMTVHHSKGLQFPIVFMAGLTSGPPIDTAAFKFDQEYGVGLKIYDSKTRTKTVTPMFEAVRQAKKQSDISEMLRIYYVAATRPKDNLFIISAKEGAEKNLSSAASRLSPDYFSKGEALDPVLVEDAKNFGELINYCVLLHPSGKKLRAIADANIISDSKDDENTEIKYIPSDQIKRSEEKEISEQIPDESFDQTKLDEIKKQLDFEYKYSALSKLAAKVSVSALTHKSPSNSGCALRPAFLKNERLNVAEKGTAMHEFMQYADYLSAEHDLENEISLLKEQQFISPAAADSLNREKLGDFFSGELFGRMKSCEKVLREQRFIIDVPAITLDPFLPDTAANEPIAVQGIADCIFIENGGAVIVDYKTDRVENEQALIDRYSAQLNLYAKAFEKILNMSVKQKIIYSFHLSKAITL